MINPPKMHQFSIGDPKVKTISLHGRFCIVDMIGNDQSLPSISEARCHE